MGRRCMFVVGPEPHAALSRSVRSLAVRLVVGSALVLGLVAPAAAGWKGTLGFWGFTAVGAGIGLAVGGPAAVVTGVAGGVVGLAVGSVCYLLDPPDLVNFDTRANPALLTYPLPVEPTWTLALGNLAQAMVNAASLLIQSTKAITMTEDRLSGALLVGTALDVSHQRAWQADNYDTARLRAAMVGSTTSAYLSQLALEDPLAANQIFDSATLKLIRDQEALGVFSQQIQDLRSFYGLDVGVLQRVGNGFAGVSNADIDSLGPVSYSQILSQNAQVCATCLVSEPSSTSLVGLALAGLLGLVGRRRGLVRRVTAGRQAA